MARTRTTLDIAAGKLISAIQRVWNDEAGEPAAERSEQAMNAAHRLLQAAKAGSLGAVLGSGTVSDYLGRDWIRQHSSVWPHVQVFEAALLEIPPGEQRGV